MNRRQALGAMAAGLASLIPSWQLLQEKRRHFRLQDFCAKTARRYDMTKPFVQSGKLFATDGRICIRLPTHLDDTLSDEIKLPPADSLEWWRKYSAWPKVEGPARLFKGEGYCLACKGSGWADAEECEPCEGYGCNECRGNGEVGTVQCSVCHGKPFGMWENTVRVTAGDQQALLDRSLFEKVQRIGGVQMRLKPGDCVTAIQFDGGDGMLMALDPSAAHRYTDTGKNL